MDKRIAAVLALAAGTSLSGCVAAVIPAIAGSTMVGTRVLDKDGEGEAKAEAAPAPAPRPSPTPVAVPKPAPSPVPTVTVAPGAPVAPAPDPTPVQRVTIVPLSQPPAPAPAPAPTPAPKPEPVVTITPPPLAPAPAPAAPGPIAAYPDPARPLAPGQLTFARFVRYTQTAARQAAEGAELPSAMLSDPVALDGKRRRCAVGEQLVAVIDLDPAGSIFAPPASPAKQPGLALGLTVLREAGVEIAWISDLTTDKSGSLRTALEQSGLDPRGQDIISLRRDESDTKDQRRSSLGGIACIVAIAGDERPDFDLRFRYLRNPEAGAGIEPIIGDGWFLIEPLLGK